MKSPLLALTLGDPCGIGPEIAAKALCTLKEDWRQRLVVIGPLSVLDKAFASLGLVPPPMVPVTQDTPKAVKVVDITESGPYEPGKVCAEGGKAALKAIETAHGLCMSGTCTGMITGRVM